MKNIIYLLLAVCLFVSCSDDEGDSQDYTSFVLLAKEGASNFPEPKVGYYDDEGKCILIKQLRNIENNIPSEEVILSEYIPEVYIFYSYGEYSNLRLEKTLRLKKNTKNTLLLDGKGIRIAEINEYTWPH
ncbi:hypothetical protein M2138_001730 [Dysgonomonadaceae bacterium PH5-43]|nr:hypothetical protein [Dysgonomonadaceae bacterium PH5-43]